MLRTTGLSTGPWPGQGGGGGVGEPHLRQTVAKQLGKVATEMLRKNLSIAPTIEIRAGYEFGVMVSQDIILPPYGQNQTAIRRINRR